jgi:hypothetical protein
MIYSVQNYRLGIRPNVTARQLSGLGDVTAPPATVTQTQAQATQFSAQLQQAGNDLAALGAAAASNATVGAVLEVQLADARQKYNTLLQQFTAWATSWNGIWQAVSAVFNAVTFNPVPAIQMGQQLAAQISQLATLQSSIADMKAQLASIATQDVNITQGSSVDYSALAADAYSNGSTALGDYYSGLAASAQSTAQAQAINTNIPAPVTPAAPTDFLTWVEDNAVWIAVIGVAVFLGPSIIKKF